MGVFRQHRAMLLNHPVLIRTLPAVVRAAIGHRVSP
jgi:hypothetical protein